MIKDVGSFDSEPGAKTHTPAPPRVSSAALFSPPHFPPFSLQPCHLSRPIYKMDLRLEWENATSVEDMPDHRSRKKRRKYIARAWYVFVRCRDELDSHFLHSNECKRRKIKCNGQTPCYRCGRQHIDCVYVENPRRESVDEQELGTRFESPSYAH